VIQTHRDPNGTASQLFGDRSLVDLACYRGKPGEASGGFCMRCEHTSLRVEALLSKRLDKEVEALIQAEHRGDRSVASRRRIC
jgi:hypothetical protein